MLKAKLDKEFYRDGIRCPTKALVEMLHSCTPEENKDNYLTFFQNLNH